MNEPNMIKAIEPKSDQLNYDDVSNGRKLTIKITKVIGLEGEQKIAIHYEDDNGKPYKPGKSMCRVLVAIWGDKGKEYVGKSMTLYGDPEVIFGSVKVGGIRISHMSGITEPHVIALTNKKGSRKPFTVNPLVAATIPPLASTLTPNELSQLKTAAQTAASGGNDVLRSWWSSAETRPHHQTLGMPFLEEMKLIAQNVDAAASSVGVNGPNDQ